MNLTTAQRTNLKAAVLADQAANALFVEGNLQGLADYYNLAAEPVVTVWKSSVATADLYDQVTWANLTPAGAVGADAAWTNRALACQGQQFNLQIILQGREFIDPSKLKIRNGLENALTDVPSGANGALRQAGWAGVRAEMLRPATRFEALFSTGTGTEQDPGKLGLDKDKARIEGTVPYTQFVGL